MLRIWQCFFFLFFLFRDVLFSLLWNPGLHITKVRHVFTIILWSVTTSWASVPWLTSSWYHLHAWEQGDDQLSLVILKVLVLFWLLPPAVKILVTALWACIERWFSAHTAPGVELHNHSHNYLTAYIFGDVIHGHWPEISCWWPHSLLDCSVSWWLSNIIMSWRGLFKDDRTF